jgi:hypothetical protein
LFFALAEGKNQAQRNYAFAKLWSGCGQLPENQEPRTHDGSRFA